MDQYFSIESGVGDPPEETESTDDLWASWNPKAPEMTKELVVAAQQAWGDGRGERFKQAERSCGR